ncbi:MAG: divergent polysaccharide deacetylase family protein [Myxococcota bacterium]
MAAAPLPPDPPPASEDEKTIRQREVDMIVRDTQQWQREHGDRVLPWDEAKGHLAIVIDDVGRELHLFEQLLALRYPLTFSVLPGSVYAAGVQTRLRGDRRRYREIMLHLPMEPSKPSMMFEGAESGERFLRLGEDPATLRAAVEDALARVPAAVGVNNHMGSALTRDEAAMREVMAVLAPRPLYFIDSRTIGDTQAEAMAQRAGVPSLRREVFLDHDPSAAAIEAALEHAAQLSHDHPVVAIAHPSPEVVEVLGRRLPDLYAQGVAVYPASRLVAASRAAKEHASSSPSNAGFGAQEPPLPRSRGGSVFVAPN